MSQTDIENNLKETLKLIQASQALVTVEFLESLASTFGCEWATYWSTEKLIGKLSTCMIWDAPHTQAVHLNHDTKLRRLTLNEGIPGQVWNTKKVFWSNDIEMDMSLPRSIYAHDSGFKSGIWIPIVCDQKVYGVIELLSRQPSFMNQHLLSIMQKFGSDVGYLKKKRAP